MPRPEELPRQFASPDLPRGYVGRTGGVVFTHLDAGGGMSPFNQPDIVKNSEENYTELDLEPARVAIRERFGLAADSEVVLGFEGSNEILERLFLMAENNTDVWAIGPHFFGALKSIRFARRSKYGVISPPLDMPLETVLNSIIGYRPPRSSRNEIASTYESQTDSTLKHSGAKVPDFIYWANPDARGDVASKETADRFIDYWTSRKVIVITDQAIADFLPDDQTPGLNNPYSIVVRSFSKAFRLPDEGIAYMITHSSNGIAQEYRKQLRDYHYRGVGKKELLLNLAQNQSQVLAELEITKDLTQRYKSLLIDSLNEAGIKFLPTSPQTPMLIVDLVEDNAFENLDLEVVPGSGYFETYNPEGRFQHMTNRFVRVGIPQVDIDQQEEAISLLVKRLKGTINVIKKQPPINPFGLSI